MNSLEPIHASQHATDCCTSSVLPFASIVILRHVNHDVAVRSCLCFSPLLVVLRFKLRTSQRPVVNEVPSHLVDMDALSHSFASACICSARDTLMPSSPLSSAPSATVLLSNPLSSSALSAVRRSPPLPATILACYVNEAHMRLEEQWDEANAAEVSERASITDLTSIQEISSDEVEVAMALEDMQSRRSAVQAEAELHRRLLPFVTAADDEHDESIQLWRTQQRSDSNSTSEDDRAARKYDDASEDDSEYSEDSAGSRRQSSADDSRHAPPTVRVGVHKRTLVVRTRAMRRRAQQEVDKKRTRRKAQLSSAKQPATGREHTGDVSDTSRRENASSSDTDNNQRDDDSQMREQADNTSARIPELAGRGESDTHKSDASPKPPQPPPPPIQTTELALPVDTEAATQQPINHRAAAPSPSQPQQQKQQHEPSSFVPVNADNTAAAAASLEFEQVTLAEHAAKEQQMLRLLAKDIRREGRQAHEEQQKQQIRERAAREQTELAEEDDAKRTMTQWLVRARELWGPHKKRIRAGHSKDERSVKVAKREEEQHSQESVDELDTARCPHHNREPVDGEKHRNAAAHRKGGRYSQLPGTTTANTQPSHSATGQRDTDRDRRVRRQKKARSKRKEEDEEWLEDEGQALRSRHAERQHAVARWMAEPAASSFFHPPTAAAVDCCDSSAITERDDSSCSTVSLASACVSASSGSVSNTSASSIVVQPRD